MLSYFKILIFAVILAYLWSCEEVVQIDLNDADPAFVVEGIICKDSVCTVRLTKTANYFSQEEPEVIDDASIVLKDGAVTETLTYIGNGYYSGNTIIGTEEQKYDIEINQNGNIYKGESLMPSGSLLNSVTFSKSNEVSILNPYGDLVFTISCQFNDNPAKDNYYMICFISEGDLIEKRFFLMTETTANGGSFENTDNIIGFSESIFYDGGEVEVQLYTIDKNIYNYFLQLDDILFWKRRYIPPVPYNPKSNISNGALGYFAAWAYDSKRIILE